VLQLLDLGCLIDSNVLDASSFGVYTLCLVRLADTRISSAR